MNLRRLFSGRRPPSFRRPSRSFRPSSLGGSQLEPIRLLCTADFSEALAVIADAKQQYKEDLAEWKQDMIIHQNNVIQWQNDRNNFNVLVLALKVDVRQFNDNYHPKLISIKSTTEFDATTGKTLPKFVLEADLTGVAAALLPNGQTERDALKSRADALTAEQRSLESRQAVLTTADNALGERKMEFDNRRMELDGMEGALQSEQEHEECEITDFDDSDLEELEQDVPEMDHAILTEIILDMEVNDVYENSDDDDSI